MVSLYQRFAFVAPDRNIKHLAVEYVSQKLKFRHKTDSTAGMCLELDIKFKVSL